MSLHDGDVPVSSAGMGTQRLTAIAVQNLSVADGAILLFDEVELGLEPHRIRHLLRMLRRDASIGQVFLTSHSPVAIAELRAPELSIAQKQAGAIKVRRVSEDLQAVVRASAEALLSRSVLVCEGKTEVGLCRAWDRRWQANGKLPLAHRGAYTIDGGGSSAPDRALGLQRLGYRVALFIDADVTLGAKKRRALREAQIEVIEWSEGKNTEQRACQDLPWSALQKLVEIGCEQRGEAAVKQCLEGNLGQSAVGMTLNGLDFRQWLEAGIGDDDLRQAIAKCSTIKGREWFKRIDLGEALGEIVADALPEIPGTDLQSKIQTLETWIHGD